jgi:hypothetical protein
MALRHHVEQVRLARPGRAAQDEAALGPGMGRGQPAQGRGVAGILDEIRRLIGRRPLQGQGEL